MYNSPCKYVGDDGVCSKIVRVSDGNPVGIPVDCTDVWKQFVSLKGACPYYIPVADNSTSATYTPPTHYGYGGNPL